MKYGKLLNNGEISYAPYKIRIQDTYYTPVPKNWATNNGFLEIVDTLPQDNQSTYTWKIINNKIVKVWK